MSETTKKKDSPETRQTVEAQLRGGEAAINEWNSLPFESKAALDLKNLDLSGADLTNMNLSNLDFSGTNFSGTNFTGANLEHTGAEGCNFDKAVFHDASLACLRAEGSTFRDANFKNAEGVLIYFIDANLTNARFENASLKLAQFHGSNMTGAIFKDCDLQHAQFDIHTVLPENFEYLYVLVFAGEELDPRIGKTFNDTHSADGINFTTFLDRIGQALDKERLDKALIMLKNERMTLFSEVKGDSLIGVVRSQTEYALFYSCRLTSDGNYYCCDQLLELCDDLSDGICHHIVLLLIGLAKAVLLDPKKADLWLQASIDQEPRLDKEIASQTFLRHKKAEAGEMDWRPTETTPEDFYAF